MATFKAEVYAHQKKQDGTYNIKIRVTHNQRKKYLPTTYYVTKEDLTRALKIKNQYYVDETDQLIKKYRKTCDKVGERLKAMTVDQVVDLITGDNLDENFDIDFVKYGRHYASQLKETGHAGTAKNYIASLNNLVKYVGRESISIREITVKFLNNYVKWIQDQPPLPNRKKGDRAQSLYLSNLRAIYNHAKLEYNDEELGIIRIPFSPFNKIQFPKEPIAEKRALDIMLIKKICNLEYQTEMQQGKNNRYNLSKDVFLLSFALLGMNTIDLYNCGYCDNGRITYERTKTRNRRADKALISVKIEPEIINLIEKYKDPEKKRMFIFYKMYAGADTFNAAINIGLKEIGKKIGIDDLEFYAARHSWATIALNNAKVDKYTVHTALNHVDEKMKVTDLYIKKSWDPIDEANRMVLDLVGIESEKATCKGRY